MKKKILTLALALSLLVALIIPASVALAQAGSGTTGVSGTLATTYALTPPATIDFGSIAAAGPYTSGVDTVTALTNDGSMNTVDIGVADISGNLGFLTLAPNSFATALQVIGDELLVYTTVGGTDIYLTQTGGTLVSGSYSVTDFQAQQTIVAGDLVLPAGSYSTTLTFTATFSP